MTKSDAEGPERAPLLPCRRAFLRTAAISAGAAIGGTSMASHAMTPSTHSKRRTGAIPRRPFGRTGEHVFTTGIGGHAIGLAKIEAVSQEELDGLRARCRTQALDGRFELYKSSKKFDGPPGREQHRFPPAEQMKD